MRKPNQPRIDYAPCPAANEAIDKAAQKWQRENLGRQAVIDKLVILGLWVEEQREHLKSMPLLYGRQRKQWKR